MNWFNKKIPFYRKKKFIIPVSLILFLTLLRIIAPPVILKTLNTKLENFSPTLTAHVDELDLKILRGGIELEGITADLKKGQKNFLKVDSVYGFVDLKQLIKGNIVAKADIDTADFTYSEDLMKAIKVHKEDKKDEEKTPPPDIRVARVDIKDSLVRLETNPKLTKENGVLINDIDARLTNLIPSKDLPETMFSIQAKILKSGAMKVNGEALTSAKPAKWDMDYELLHFNLPELNSYLKDKVPLTFTKGKLDLYVEAKSEEGKVSGYIKPFVKELDVIKSKEDMKNPKHWFFEVVTALGNTTLSSDKETASRVPFEYDGKMKAEKGKALTQAFTHGFIEEIPKGIENSIQL